MSTSNVADEYKECYIVGGGPSLKDFDWSLLKDKFVIAINRSYEVLPEAQIVYFTDDDWYTLHKEQLKVHSGIKIKGSLQPNVGTDSDVIHFHLVRADGLATGPKQLSHGNNSTYAAINLAAVHLHFKKIYLLGVDMKWSYTNSVRQTHWHDGHSRIDPEEVYRMMIQRYNTMVAPLRAMGVEVINVNSPYGTELKAFPIKSVEQVFGKK